MQYVPKMLASSRDQLGEHMQINEITRRKLNEVGFAAGLATGLQGALSKVGVQGPALEPSQSTGPTMNRAQALAQAQKQVQTLIPVMQKNWAKAVQDTLAQSTDPATSAPATGVDKMTTGDQNSLKAKLVALVNSAVYPQYHNNTKTYPPKWAKTPQPKHKPCRWFKILTVLLILYFKVPWTNQQTFNKPGKV
jgi:hypothetical protein